MKIILTTNLIKNGKIIPKGTVIESGVDIPDEEYQALAKGPEARSLNADLQVAQSTPAPIGPTPKELEETRKCIEQLEGDINNAMERMVKLEDELYRYQQITDAELAGILKGRKVKAPADATRETLLGHITAGAQPGATEIPAAGTDEPAGDPVGTEG
jgi:hypothetical protein